MFPVLKKVLYTYYFQVMKPLDLLVVYFNNILKLNPAEEAILSEVFVARSVKRRQYLLQAGDVSKYNTFVVEGCFKMYHVDQEAKEHNLQFAPEHWWVGDISSFYDQEPSRLYIEAMEPSTVLQISRTAQCQLFVDFPKFNRLFRVITDNALVAAQRRIIQNISSTAEERYVDFMRSYPDLFNRISNVQVASYLGVTPEFLSTIRKRMAKS